MLPVSRICFSLCSSAAVHGVFVLAFRGLSLLSGDRSAGIDTFAAELLSVAGGLDDGGFTSSLFCSAAGLLDAGRLRGFGGEATGGGRVFSMDRGSIGTGKDCKGSIVLGGDETPELAVLGRLVGGGVLRTSCISTDPEVKTKSTLNRSCATEITYAMLVERSID